MNSDLHSLSKIFTEKLFRIPDYQRGYSWNERQLKDFWSDLVLLETNRDHYTGVLTLEGVTDEQVSRWDDDLWIVKSKRYTPYYVVDGQQRLTTSIILVQAIVERLGSTDELNFTTASEIRKKFIFESKDKGVSRSYIFGYEKDNPSYEFLKTDVFGEVSDNHGIGEQTAYTKNLRFAKEFFAGNLRECTVLELEQLFTKLTQHFVFNIYTIAGHIDVFVAFETMNNRGKPLSHLELLKNRLIFLSTRLQVEEPERKQLRVAVNEAWKTIYHYLGCVQDGPLLDDHFLWVHFVLYFGPEVIESGRDTTMLWRYRHEDFYKEFLLNEIFTPRKASLKDGSHAASRHVSLEGIYSYVKDIKNAVQLYHDLFNPRSEKYTQSQQMDLMRLQRLGWVNSQPLIVAILGAKPSQLELSEFLKAVERYAFFVVLLVQHRPSRTLNIQDLVHMAIASRQKKLKIDSIISSLNNAVNEQSIAESPLLVGQTAQEGYYQWRGIHYFLFEYEQFLKGKSKSDRDKISWDDFVSEKYEQDYATIEHIFPQKPKDDYWEERFRGLSTAQRKSLRNSLGNLLALSRAKNASLGNRPFPQKKEGLADSPGYNVGSYSEIEVARLDDWSPQEILKRGHALLDFLEKRWRIKLGDPIQKAKILGIDFLVNPRSPGG